MASAQSSQDMWHGRGRQAQTLGNAQPRRRSESRRLSDRRRPVKTVARKLDHHPGALHEGDTVCVFSRSADEWVDGEVVKFEKGNFVRAEYKVGQYWYGKTLHVHSDHLFVPVVAASEEPGSLRPRDRVEIFSKTANAWFEAEVEHVENTRVRVLLESNGNACRKTVHINHAHFRSPSAIDGPQVEVSAKFRGVSAGQFEKFFKEFCGDIIYDEADELKPICLPSKLAVLCVRGNLADPDRAHPYEPNLYAVNDFLIKPHTLALNISYAELLNRNGKIIDFFLSHHWAENFAEFVQSILRHASSVAPTLGRPWYDIVYWCCAFANNQHQVDLGQTLELSPFHLALSSPSCQGTVLNLNQMASALFRVWVDYEAFLTHTLDKPFIVNTCQGPISEAGLAGARSDERDLWVVHLFLLLQEVDIEKAATTDPSDKTKIMQAVDQFHGRGVADGQVGPQALNVTLKAVLASQAIFVLARRGETELIKTALALGADPNTPDARGIQPLTYAAAIHGESHCATAALVAGGADKKASFAAKSVLDMWADDPQVHSPAIKKVEELGACHQKALAAARKHQQGRDYARCRALLQSADVRERVAVLQEMVALCCSGVMLAHEDKELVRHICKTGDAEEVTQAFQLLRACGEGDQANGFIVGSQWAVDLYDGACQKVRHYSLKGRLLEQFVEVDTPRARHALHITATKIATLSGGGFVCVFLGVHDDMNDIGLAVVFDEFFQEVRHEKIVASSIEALPCGHFVAVAGGRKDSIAVPGGREDSIETVSIFDPFGKQLARHFVSITSSPFVHGHPCFQSCDPGVVAMTNNSFCILVYLEVSFFLGELMMYDFDADSTKLTLSRSISLDDQPVRDGYLFAEPCAGGYIVVGSSGGRLPFRTLAFWNKATWEASERHVRSAWEAAECQVTSTSRNGYFVELTETVKFTPALTSGGFVMVGPDSLHFFDSLGQNIAETQIGCCTISQVVALPFGRCGVVADAWREEIGDEGFIIIFDEAGQEMGRTSCSMVSCLAALPQLPWTHGISTDVIESSHTD